MKKIYLLLIWVFCSVLASCTHPKNDCDLYFQGQYVVEQNGTLVPFHKKLMCLVTVTMYSQVSYGVSTYNPTYNCYSEEDGSFEYIINGTGSNRARLSTTMLVDDTLLYNCDTMLSCSYGRPQKNVQLLLSCQHHFAPTLTPAHFCFDDTLTFSINHDVLTHIELCYSGEDEEGNHGYVIPAWSSPVECVPSFSFVFPEVLKTKGRCCVKYTTLHYGTYKRVYSTPSQRFCE